MAIEATKEPMATEATKEAMATVAERAPVTAQRKVRSELDTKLPKPYLPRAMIAPDSENINGMWGHKHNNMSVLQQHAAFFDRDNDGIIYNQETYRGFRALGFNPVASFFFMILVHGSMSYATSPHGSDSGTYNTEGRYIPANLEKMFSKYARTMPDKLKLQEIWEMTKANRDAFDFFGWAASKLEWETLYLLAKDEDGYLSKEAVRRCFDGSLFEFFAKLNKGLAKKEE